MVRRIFTASGSYASATELLPGEKAVFSLSAQLPAALPPTFSGTAARFAYSIEVKCTAEQADENIQHNDGNTQLVQPASLHHSIKARASHPSITCIRELVFLHAAKLLTGHESNVHGLPLVCGVCMRLRQHDSGQLESNADWQVVAAGEVLCKLLQAPHSASEVSCREPVRILTTSSDACLSGEQSTLQQSQGTVRGSQQLPSPGSYSRTCYAMAAPGEALALRVEV